MQIFFKIKETKELIKKWKAEGYSIGFVPTMGYLHEGHTSLIERARAENDKVVVSIFVNPTQFAPSEDLDSYPRDLEKDKDLCDKAGADLIFHPDTSEMYPDSSCTFVDMYKVSKELCGKSRPTHFRGVCTVVNKLFNIIEPDKAYFGQKDAQQLAVIKRMVNDLNINTEIVDCPIIREEDGLAKSSRNIYLNEKERSAALILQKALIKSGDMIIEGERSSEILIETMRNIINSEPLAKIDYIEIVNNDTIEKINIIDLSKNEVLVAVAVFIGKTRLIDNFILKSLWRDK